jgi:hypothetical protein
MSTNNTSTHIEELSYHVHVASDNVMEVTPNRFPNITREQIEDETVRYFHMGQCKRIFGVHGGVKDAIITFFRNGKTKTWKTRPTHFHVPIHRGMYNKQSLNHENVGHFHLAANCPLNDVPSTREGVTVEVTEMLDVTTKKLKQKVWDTLVEKVEAEQQITHSLSTERQLAAGILSIIDAFLEERNVIVPDDERENIEDPAAICGTGYYELEDTIAKMLEGQAINKVCGICGSIGCESRHPELAPITTKRKLKQVEKVEAERNVLPNSIRGQSLKDETQSIKVEVSVPASIFFIVTVPKDAGEDEIRAEAMRILADHIDFDLSNRLLAGIAWDVDTYGGEIHVDDGSELPDPSQIISIHEQLVPDDGFMCDKCKQVQPADVDPYETKGKNLCGNCYDEEMKETKWRVDCQGTGENIWSSNGLEYDDSFKAVAYAKDLYSRWMGMVAWRVVPTSTPRQERVIDEHKGQVVVNGKVVK